MFTEQQIGSPPWTRYRYACGDGEKEDGLPGSAARLEERRGDQEVRTERREERRLLLQVGHLAAPAPPSPVSRMVVRGPDPVSK